MAIIKEPPLLNSSAAALLLDVHNAPNGYRMAQRAQNITANDGNQRCNLINPGPPLRALEAAGFIITRKTGTRPGEKGSYNYEITDLGRAACRAMTATLQDFPTPQQHAA